MQKKKKATFLLSQQPREFLKNRRRERAAARLQGRNLDQRESLPSLWPWLAIIHRPGLVDSSPGHAPSLVAVSRPHGQTSAATPLASHLQPRLLAKRLGHAPLLDPLWPRPLAKRPEATPPLSRLVTLLAKCQVHASWLGPLWPRLFLSRLRSRPLVKPPAATPPCQFHNPHPKSPPGTCSSL